jgi:hypothetical protein
MKNCKFKIYTGTLSDKKMPPEVNRAYRSYRAQKERCRVGKGSYSGKSVSYTVREFIGWWLQEKKKRKKWHRPCAGRIDHGKGYFFGNIELIEISENTAERNRRYTSRVIVFNPKTNVLKLFSSLKEAAEFCGCHQNNIAAACEERGRRTLSGFRFYYAD